MTFDLGSFYKAIHEGENPDPGPFLAYLSGFDRIILWGAGVIGEAVGARLLEQGIRISTFWDKRSTEMGTVLGLPVIQPYALEEGQDLGRTCVVICISSLMVGTIQGDLHEHGYTHVVHGYNLYQGFVCPFTARSGIEPQVCHAIPGCNPAWCDKLHGIVKNHTRQERGSALEEPLHINVLTFVINQRCTLTCKHCTSYLNRYEKPDRVDFPLERIQEDIDKVMGAMDSVGHITIMGGETFLHRDLGAICDRLLTKTNFGTAIVATSGTCLIRPEQLEAMKDPRICVSLVNYLGTLSPPFQRIYHKNVELMHRSGIQFRQNPSTPTWRIPSTLYDLGNTPEEKAAKRDGCAFPTYAQVKNGKLLICDFGNALYSLKLADYPADYVDIAAAPSIPALRESIQKWLARPCFDTCGHCAPYLGLVSVAAEQGYIDFMQPVKPAD